MTLPRAIEHITITTGAARMSPRTEVDTRVLLAVRRDMAAGRPLMGTPWTIAHQASPEGGRVYDLIHNGAAIVRCWLCLNRAASDAMWDAAQSGILDERVRLARPRGGIWLAAAILPGALVAMQADPSIIGEAGDLERVVAWAMLEDGA